MAADGVQRAEHAEAHADSDLEPLLGVVVLEPLSLPEEDLGMP